MPPIEASVTNQQISATLSEAGVAVSVPAASTVAAAVEGGVGPTGSAGAAATISVGTVTTGAPGSSASVVNAGSSSAAVFNFAIPAGAIGATGSQGPAGAAGAAGAAATISVGTVTTGAPGSSATVTNSGTSSAAVLDFAIPAGAAGSNGATGATGPAGSSGVISVSAPITNSGSASSASLGLATGAGLAVSGGSLIVSGLGIADISGLQTALDGKQASGSYAAATHSHAASDVTSGTFDVARLPVGTGATQVAAGNDARLSDSRAPTGAAGGSLSGTYPNPSIAAGAVGTTALADSGVTDVKISAVDAAKITTGTIAVARLPIYTRLSDTVSNVSYIGLAVSGSATSASVWRIKRTTISSAGAVSASVTASNVKWDDRLTATYS